MFCPQCHAEYREGFDECVDCNCPLVDELPLDADDLAGDLELTTVLTTDSSETAETARSILEDVGIDFNVKGGGFDQVAVGYNHIVGPILIQVYEEDCEQAARLLEHLEDGAA